MKTAVLGHMEWGEFALVERVPEPGDIVHARETFELPAGGAAVAAVQIARLGGNCLFMTAAGSDVRGDQVIQGLEERGLRVEAVRRETDQRRVFVFLDDQGERTITTIGERLGPEVGDSLPWDELGEVDALYFTAGNADTLKAARAAKMVVASVRAREALAQSDVQVDVLVASANDKGELYERGEFDRHPRWVVRTDGARGGTLEAEDGTVTNWSSVPPTGGKIDSYGAGDTFAGGLTYGLARGFPIEKAIAFAAFCGSSSVRGRGPYAGHVSPQELLGWEKANGVSPAGR